MRANNFEGNLDFLFSNSRNLKCIDFLMVGDFVTSGASAIIHYNAPWRIIMNNFLRLPYTSAMYVGFHVQQTD
jgi:hypothetical protein